MFRDRAEAGTLLGQKIVSLNLQPAFILGLARGGVVVAASLGQMMRVPVDVLVVKKIGSPQNDEFAIGAVAPDGIYEVNDALAKATGADPAYIRSRVSSLRETIEEKIRIYRYGKPALDISGKTVVLADDGAATGASMIAASRWARRKGARTIIIALPVASPDVGESIRQYADTVIILEEPEDFGAVSDVYNNFLQLTDEDVVKLLV